MADAYSHVEARYLDARKPPPQAVLPQRENIPRSEAYAAVEPRYLSPRRVVQPPPGAPGGPPLNIPRDPSFRREDHAQVVKARFASVSSRFINQDLYVSRGDQSPRRLAELRHQENKRLYGWRTDTAAARHMTFDDHAKLTAKRGGFKPSAAAAALRGKAPSMIYAYIHDGVPIKHHSTAALREAYEQQALAAKHSSPNIVASSNNNNGALSPGANGRARSAPGSRNASPARGTDSRSGSPTSRRWSNAGWQNQTFDERRGVTLQAQPMFQREQRRVEDSIRRLASARVPSVHVPRVAQLSPGYQAALWRREVEQRQQQQQQRQEGTPREGSDPRQNGNADGRPSPGGAPLYDLGDDTGDTHA